MTHAEQEEILRRALHAVADQIEPAADGLEQIRERLSKPRPLGMWLRPAVVWLLTTIRLLLPRSGMSRHEKLRAALAFAAAALIGTVGGLALSPGLLEHVIQDASSIFSPSQAPSAHGGHDLVTNGSGPHAFPSASRTGTYTRHESSPITSPRALRGLRPAQPPRHRRPPPHRRARRHRRPDQHSHRHPGPEPGRRLSLALHQPHLSSRRQL